MADDLEQYVTFDTTADGEYSLRLFIKIAPETWQATFYEVDHHDGHFVTQYFRTKHPINRFVASPLVKGLPGAVDWEWNGVDIASSNSNTRHSSKQVREKQAKERWRKLMQERDEAIAELQTLIKKASEVHEEIKVLLGTQCSSQNDELVRAKNVAQSLVSSLILVTDMFKKAQESQK